jgi:hypothetical protein
MSFPSPFWTFLPTSKMPSSRRLSDSEIPFYHHARITGSSFQITSLICLLVALQIIKGVLFILSILNNVPLTDLHNLRNRVESHIFHTFTLITEPTSVASQVRLPSQDRDTTLTKYECRGSRYLDPVIPVISRHASSSSLKTRYQLRMPWVRLRQMHGAETEALRCGFSKKDPELSPGVSINSQKASSESHDSATASPFWQCGTPYNSPATSNSQSHSVYSVKSEGDGGSKENSLPSSTLITIGSGFTELYNDILRNQPEFSSMSHSSPRLSNPLLRLDSPLPPVRRSPSPNRINTDKGLGDHLTFPGKFPVSDNLDFSSLATVSQDTSQYPRLKRRPFSAPSARF